MAVLGVDIGGSGIKGAPVDTDRGDLVGERFRVKTPASGRPDELVASLGAVIEHHRWSGPVGVTFPGVVRDGVIHTAANLDSSWIGVDLPGLVRERLGVDVVAVNDADAAGVAEVAHGAARGASGLVIVLTFGTGVGSAMLIDGRLVPNTEIGHLELAGEDAERQVAESARERNDWSWKKWAKRANDYLALVENLFWPTLLVIGGGIAKKPDQWQPLLRTRARLEVAALGNLAGIVGAAMTAYDAT